MNELIKCPRCQRSLVNNSGEWFCLRENCGFTYTLDTDTIWIIQESWAYADRMTWDFAIDAACWRNHNRRNAERMELGTGVYVLPIDLLAYARACLDQVELAEVEAA